MSVLVFSVLTAHWISYIVSVLSYTVYSCLFMKVRAWLCREDLTGNGMSVVARCPFVTSESSAFLGEH